METPEGGTGTAPLASGRETGGLAQLAGRGGRPGEWAGHRATESDRGRPSTRSPVLCTTHSFTDPESTYTRVASRMSSGWAASHIRWPTSPRVRKSMSGHVRVRQGGRGKLRHGIVSGPGRRAGQGQDAGIQQWVLAGLSPPWRPTRHAGRTLRMGRSEQPDRQGIGDTSRRHDRGPRSHSVGANRGGRASC